jgi:ketosteroid isomerase-like protein
METVDTLSRVKRHLIAVLLVACGGGTPRPSGEPLRPHPPKQPSPELSQALVPLDWWLGHWESNHGDEHWVAAGGAIYGIGLAKDGRFEVMIVDDAEGPGKPDGKLRFLAMPGGSGSTQFDLSKLDGEGAMFANPAHDFPKTIHYRISMTPCTANDCQMRKLAATVAGDGKAEDFLFAPKTIDNAPELEAVDRAFSDDVGKRKLEAWLAAFAPDGGMLRKGKRIEGAAIGEMMGPVLAGGTLAWQPIASAKRDQVGFTVGKATFTGAKPEDSWKSTYVTIWKQQPDGAWKVWFDTGRPVNE